MKNIATFIVLILALQAAIGQNLVPNPSFEDTVFCPSTISDINLSSGWSSYSNTPDYFNSCSTNNDFSVPQNGWGYQNASHCNSYAGLWAYYHPFSKNGREYIGRELSNELIVGNKYFVSVKVCLAEISNCGINKIGILFSTTPFSQTQPFLVNNAPHVFTNEILTDTNNWKDITGSFIADSAYKYIIIGNFFDDNNSDTVIIAPEQYFGYGAYYYIDDICVSLDSSTCNPFIYNCNSNVMNINYDDWIRIFPNPFNDITFLKFNTREHCDFVLVSITDIFGKTILYNKIEYRQKIEISRNNLPAGVYILTVTFNNKSLRQKIVITN